MTPDNSTLRAGEPLSGRDSDICIRRTHDSGHFSDMAAGTVNRQSEVVATRADWAGHCLQRPRNPGNVERIALWRTLTGHSIARQSGEYRFIKAPEPMLRPRSVLNIFNQQVTYQGGNQCRARSALSFTAP